MPPSKDKSSPSVTAGATEDEDLDAIIEVAIRANQGVNGSPVALRLEQEQREARERAEAEATDAMYTCGACGTEAKMKCSSCATVHYCGKQCQVAHWPAHKARCRVLRAEAAVVAAEAEAAAARSGEHEEEEQEVVHNPNTEAGNCWTCGADNPRNVCNRCKVSKYCGVACQTENWPIHKGRCVHLKLAAESLAEAKDDLKKVKKGSGVRKSPIELYMDLCCASMLGRVVDIERVVSAGGVDSINRGPIFPLTWAAQDGHTRAIGVLVRHGARVDGRDSQGATAIHSASEFGQLKAVETLLELGANVNAIDSRGGSPLYAASQNNHSELVAVLLGNGAEVDLPSNVGVTALLIAAQAGHTAVVRLLLEHGACANLRDRDGYGALYMAALNNHTEVVALLLQAGADPLQPTNDGVSPLVVAIHQNHTEVMVLLQARIAELARARP